MTPAQFDTLELLVDSIGLPAVLDSLEVIAHEKATHILGNWQDETTAAQWTLAGTMVGAMVYELREKANLPEE